MAENQNWGLTPSGFICPTYEQVLNEKIKRAKELFGENISTNETTVLGKFLRIEAKDDQRLWQEIENVYYSASPATATGISLDRAMSFAFVKRNSPTYAVHLIRVYGVKGYNIRAGTLFRNAAGVSFYSLSKEIIGGEDGTLFDNKQPDDVMYYADVRVQCTEVGDIGNVSNIDRLAMVNTNIISVEWSSQIDEGRGVETDPNARNRYRQIVEGLGTNAKAAIIANVLKINGMYDCDIVENTSKTESVVVSTEEPMLTVAPETYGVITYGSSDVTDLEIAKAIFEKRPFGIRQSGSTTVDIPDESGTVQKMRFTKVAIKNVNIEYTIIVDDNIFEHDGFDKINAKIKGLINSLEIGEKLVFTQLYGCIYAVEGVTSVASLKLNGGTSDIEATGTQIVRTGTITGNIEV